MFAQKYVPLLLFALLVCSCTQDQAPIEDRGRQYYGREHEGSIGSYRNETYSENSPRYKSGYTHPVEPATVPSVGVSELPPANGAAAVNGDSHITVTDSTSDASPFSAPSKPLEQSSSPLTSQDKAISSSPAMGNEAAAPLTAKDGITLIWPVNGRKIIARFKGVENDGINISMSEGEPIVAAASGTVVYSGNDMKDYGNMVILRHDNGWLTAYANASKIVSKKGDYVKQGDIIAYVGSSGGVKTPQLHFALRKGKTPVDPEKYLPQISG